ncbi:MAG: hypothetical protein ACRC9L_05450 [Brevinema sp.]
MKKYRVLAVLLAISFGQAFAVELKISPFRLNYIVYYQILHKMMGVPLGEFKNVGVISETPSKLVFEYDGKRYTATTFTGQGVIHVQMPNGMNNRYISQVRFPSIVLTDFDKF